MFKLSVPDHLQDLFTSAEQWHKSDDGVSFCAYKQDKCTAVGTASRDDIGSIDPRFLEVLDFLGAQEKSRGWVSTDQMIWSLMLWQDTTFTLPGEAFIARHDDAITLMHHSFMAFAFTEDRNYSYLTCAPITVLTMPSGLNCVQDTEGTTKRLKHGWLDDHYPGWKERMLVASSLEMTGEEVAQSVFACSVAPFPVEPLASFGM